MEENSNKKDIVIIAFLALLLVLVIGLFIHFKSKKDNEKNIWIQALSKDTKEVVNLDDKIKLAKFINNQKEVIITNDFDENVNISVKIENQTIAIRALDKSVNITSIDDPISVGTFSISDDDNLDVDVYVLNKYYQLYHISFLASDISNDSVKVMLLSLPPIESFSTNVTMLEDVESWQNFIIAKSSDGRYFTDYKFSSDKEYTIREIKSKQSTISTEEDEDKTYGILSIADVNPFKYLNFNNRIVGGYEDSTDYTIDFDSSSIKYNGKYYDDSKELDQSIIINVDDVKQVGLYCDESEGSCSSIYYLTNSGNLYRVISENGKYILDDDNTYNSSTSLIDRNVVSFDLLPTFTIDIATGGEKSLIYKKNNNKTYIVYGEKIEDASIYKRYWIDDTYKNPLFVVSKEAKVTNYLKTDNSKNILAKKVFIFSGEEEDGNGDSFIYLYILNDDDYLYYSENYAKGNMQKYKDIKVRYIEQRDNDIVVTYINGEKEIIDAYLTYEAK